MRARSVLGRLLLVPAAILMGCSTPPEKPAAPAVSFSESDRATIVQYYTAGRVMAPPSRQPVAVVYKPGDLLEPGMRPRKLPVELDSKLSSVSGSYTRLVVGSDVILVNRDNHKIADVIPQIAY